MQTVRKSFHLGLDHQWSVECSHVHQFHLAVGIHEHFTSTTAYPTSTLHVHPASTDWLDFVGSEWSFGSGIFSLRLDHGLLQQTKENNEIVSL